ncbi:hypothetical protein [Maribacter ulvicola]|uniref:Cytochrome oxidase complex assembly protein 1 n=1 Tax=Maribacter ulvicola TaxID=228959 RepID=A0A1N6YWH7_9FLAO|nr:hypothetical protein [Maribacter ulvicola]SIR18900.1 hypothetical protein SAMN05421797_107176 [Maribacter ulvicola]
MHSYKRPWYKLKRTWILLFFLVFIGLFVFTLPEELSRNITYLTKAYSEPEICEGALEIAKADSIVLKLLGNLEPLGSLDMLNGSVGYSQTGDAVGITIDVRGDKQIKNIRSKMDILAEKRNDKWEYISINIRIKKPEKLKQTIAILKR